MPYGISSSRQRHDAPHFPSGDPTTASFNRGDCPKTRRKPQNRHEVAQALQHLSAPTISPHTSKASAENAPPSHRRSLDKRPSRLQMKKPAHLGTEEQAQSRLILIHRVITSFGFTYFPASDVNL
jgi:hypothetical protein